MKTKWFNFFERVLWTLLQVTSAEVLLGLWEAVNDLPQFGMDGYDR